MHMLSTLLINIFDDSTNGNKNAYEGGKLIRLRVKQDGVG